jgi:hypothetical protein
MIPVAAGLRTWISTGHTEMRKGMNGLALLVQPRLGRDPANFSPFGVDNLAELVQIHKADAGLLPRCRKPRG